MKAKITKSLIDGMTPGDIIADIDVKGFTARCLPSGSAAYGLRYRSGGKQRWLALGLHGQITPAQARKLAQKRIGEVADSRDPAAERQEQRAKASCTVNAILDSFVARHVCSLRTARQIESAFDRHVRPRIGDRSIYSLRRADVVAMLDAVEDQAGPVMADRTLAYVRRAFNWQAVRDDTFTPPMAPGMGRTKGSQRARSRIFDNQEIRDLWRALDTANTPVAFRILVRVLLLTGQRRSEVAGMSWPEVERDVWVIPATRRWKGGENTVPLTDMTLRLLGTPRDGYVFSTTNGQKPFSGFGKCKRVLDDAIAHLRETEGRSSMPHWTLHDLRRTARSLMSRAGVDSDHAERVLGHAIPGVRSVYDRHAYFEEKREALERLSQLLDRIIHPKDNVVVLRR